MSGLLICLVTKKHIPIVTEVFIRGRKLNFLLFLLHNLILLFQKNVRLNATHYFRLEVNNCNMMLTEKQQKYQHYHQVKFINMNILQVKKY